MSQYAKGWSSRRGQATHLMVGWAAEAVGVKGVSAVLALCGAPIRITDRKEMPYKKSDPRFELCDACQRKRKARRQA